MMRTTTFSFVMALAAVAFLLLLEVPEVKNSSSTLPPKDKNVTCANDSDCGGGSAGMYCNLKSKRCTCQLFHIRNGTSCLPVFCKEQFDCKTLEKDKNAGFFYTCSKNGTCLCRMPRVLSKNGAACENPHWADIVGWSALVIAVLCVLVCCFCVAFGFDKKQAAAGAGGGASKRSSRIRGGKSSSSNRR